MNKYLNKVYRATLYVAFLFTCISNQSFGNVFKHNYLWVVRDAMTTQRKIDHLIEFANKNNFDHLLVQIRGRGDALYSSEFVPRNSEISDSLFDPLDYVLKVGHENDIQIHAWMNMYILWSSENPPNNKNHLYYTHPEWIDDGELYKDLNDFTLTNFEKLNLKNGLYLSPYHEEVTPYLLNVLSEVLEKYDIDGLHLDYIRYNNVENKNINSDIKSDRKGTVVTSQVYLSTEKAIEHNEDEINYRNFKEEDYKRNTITNLVMEIRKLISALCPDCKLSAAVKPNIYLARDQFFQEWDVWLVEGYLDFVMPMNYIPSLRKFTSNIDLIYENFPEKYREKIIMGISTYNQSPSEVVQKIDISRLREFPGISIFSYNVIKEKKSYYSKITKAISE